MKVVNEADKVLTGTWSIVPAPLPLQLLLQTGPEHLTSCELEYEYTCMHHAHESIIHVCTMHTHTYMDIYT